MKARRILLMALMFTLMTAFCMLASVSVSAETSTEKIEQIDVSGVTFPELGQQSVVPNITIPDDASYSISNVIWYEFTPQSKVFSGVFSRGGLYQLSFAVTPNEGYTIDVSDKLIAEIALNINGKDARAYENINYFYCSKYDKYTSKYIVYVSFKMLQETITNVSLTYELPKIGETLKDIKLSVPSNANYTAQAEWSHIRGLDFSENDTIEAGMDWYLSFIVTPNTGFKFSSNTKLLINGTEFSNECYYDDVSIISERKQIRFFHPIESLSITSPDLECGGDFGSFTIASCSPAECDIEARYTTWTYNEANDFKSSKQCYSPTEGGYYWAEFSFEAYGAYGFTKDTVITVSNGTATATITDLGYARILVAFDPLVDTREVLKSVDIKFPTPRIGDTIDIFAPYINGTKYAISSIMLAQSEVDDVFKATEFTDQDTFKKDTYYFIGFQLEAAKGYKFSQDTVVTMNGQQQIEIEDEGYTSPYAIFRIGKLGDQSTNDDTPSIDSDTAIPNDTVSPDETTVSETDSIPDDSTNQGESTAPNVSTGESTTPDAPASADTPAPTNTAAPDNATQTPTDTDADPSDSEGNTTKTVIIAVAATATAAAAGSGIFIFRKRIFPKMK